MLKYSLTWSTEGLINEYGNPCEAIVDGRLVEAAPLEGLEEIEIDGTLYEAFNTSGGLGSLGRDLRQAVRAEHGLQDHALSGALRADAPAHERPQAQLTIAPRSSACSKTPCRRRCRTWSSSTSRSTGKQDGELREENYVNKIYPQVIAGRLWSAIQVTTAAGITAVVDLVLQQPGTLPGFVRAGRIPPAGRARRTGSASYYAPRRHQGHLRARRRQRPGRPPARSHSGAEQLHEHAATMLRRVFGARPSDQRRRLVAATAAGRRTTSGAVIDSINPATGEAASRRVRGATAADTST